MTDNNNQQPNPEEISEITNESNEDVELNEAAKWIQSIFNAPGFSKWRADKALEEGKNEKYIMNLLVDYNMKIKKCNDIADFILEY